MYNHSSTLAPMAVASMAKQFIARTRGSFGILRQNESSPLDLCAAGGAYPINYLRVCLTDQDGREFRFNKDDFPKDYQLLLDDHGRAPAKARLALFKGQTNVIAFSGEGRCVQGSILVIANTNVGPIAVNALFSEGEDGCKESSILWDRAGDLIEHWLIQDRIR